MKISKLFPNDLCRFIIIGSLSNLVNFTIYIISNYLFENLIISSILGYISGIYFSYHFGRTWVFGKIYGYSRFNLLKFYSIYILGLILMTSIIELMTNFYFYDYRISWLIGATVAFINNFIGTKYFVFNK